MTDLLGCPNEAADCGGYCWICPPPAEPKESAE